MRARQREAYDEAVAAAAIDDARALALEIAGLTPTHPVDVMNLGVVPEPEETAYRFVACWFRWRVDGQWSEALWCQVLITNQRLLMRLPDGTLRAQWWSTLVGFEVDLDDGHVVLDYGDGRPRLVSGSAAGLIGVAGTVALYGAEALVTHPGLEPLRLAPPPPRR